MQKADRTDKEAYNMKTYEVTDPQFAEYGRILTEVDITPMIEALKKTPCPEQGTIYVAGDPELEKLPSASAISSVLYGELPVQIGYCNGHNTMLNALEYHRSSEINAGTDDFYLILGKQTDITADMTYDTANCVAFHVPAGIAVEVYATTLHYAPCNKGGKGFRVLVVLPKGTNTELKDPHAGNENGHLTAVNKWLLGHPDGVEAGQPLGLVGENLSIE